jgi:hypothetical protein
MRYKTNNLTLKIEMKNDRKAWLIEDPHQLQQLQGITVCLGPTEAQRNKLNNMIRLPGWDRRHSQHLLYKVIEVYWTN